MHALTIGQAGSRLPLTFLIISVTSNPDTLDLLELFPEELSP